MLIYGYLREVYVDIVYIICRSEWTVDGYCGTLTLCHKWHSNVCGPKKFEHVAREAIYLFPITRRARTKILFLCGKSRDKLQQVLAWYGLTTVKPVCNLVWFWVRVKIHTTSYNVVYLVWTGIGILGSQDIYNPLIRSKRKTGGDKFSSKSIFLLMSFLVPFLNHP